MNYNELLEELLIELANEYKMLHQKWINTPEEREAVILTGQAMAISKIIDLINRKFKEIK